MRVIKGSPRRQARAGDRTQGRSAADSDFVFGDLAPLTRRRSQRKRLPSAIEPITKPTFQCARGTSHTAANSSNSIETSARRPQPKPCGGGGCRIYLCDLASLVASCGTARGSPAPPPKPCGGGGAWSPICCTGVVAAACTQGKRTQHGKPGRVIRDDQPDAREGQAGRTGVAERLVLPRKPGNAGGGKGPQFKTDATRGEGPGDWAT